MRKYSINNYVLISNNKYVYKFLNAITIMQTPTEIMYWEILPAIRSSFVFEMKEEHNLKQKEIAEVLGVTPAAISQYLNQKRGTYEFSKPFKQKIKISVLEILSKKSTPFEETNKLIAQFQKSKDLCLICSHKNNLTNFKEIEFILLSFET